MTDLKHCVVTTYDTRKETCKGCYFSFLKVSKFVNNNMVKSIFPSKVFCNIAIIGYQTLHTLQ